MSEIREFPSPGARLVHVDISVECLSKGGVYVNCKPKKGAFKRILKMLSNQFGLGWKGNSKHKELETLHR